VTTIETPDDATTSDEYSAEEDMKTSSGAGIVDAVVDYKTDQQGGMQNTTADTQDDEAGGTRAWDTNNDGSSDVVTGGHDMSSETSEQGIVDTTVETVEQTSTTQEANSAEVSDPAPDATEQSGTDAGTTDNQQTTTQPENVPINPSGMNLPSEMNVPGFGDLPGGTVELPGIGEVPVAGLVLAMALLALSGG
jgi:hypothetical protein